jgi:hypothetical protein
LTLGRDAMRLREARATLGMRLDDRDEARLFRMAQREAAVREMPAVSCADQDELDRAHARRVLGRLLHAHDPLAVFAEG